MTLFQEPLYDQLMVGLDMPTPLGVDDSNAPHRRSSPRKSFRDTTSRARLTAIMCTQIELIADRGSRLTVPPGDVIPQNGKLSNGRRLSVVMLSRSNIVGTAITNGLPLCCPTIVAARHAFGLEIPCGCSARRHRGAGYRDHPRRTISRRVIRVSSGADLLRYDPPSRRGRST